MSVANGMNTEGRVPLQAKPAAVRSEVCAPLVLGAEVRAVAGEVSWDALADVFQCLVTANSRKGNSKDALLLPGTRLNTENKGHLKFARLWC